jgi:hypothetical protein
VAAPLNGSRDPADSKAFFNNVRQRQATAALSLETAVASVNKMGATRDASVLPLFFFTSILHIPHSTDLLLKLAHCQIAASKATLGGVGYPSSSNTTHIDV